MPNRNLTSDELKRANALLADIRERLDSLAAGGPLLLFAYRRKVAKELGYDERGKPGSRAKLKAVKWGLQDRRCAECKLEMPLENSELDRKNAADGYPMAKWRRSLTLVLSSSPFRSGRTYSQRKSVPLAFLIST
jgi:hypothetical protein